MYQTFNIRFSVSTSKVNKDGYAPLFVSIIVNKERTYIQLPKKLKPSDFNNRTQQSSNSDINAYINIVRSRIFEIQTELFANKIQVSASKIKQVFNGIQLNKKWGILEFYSKHNENLEKMVGKTIVKDSFKKHVYVLNYLSAFTNYVDIPIHEISPSFIKNFYQYLIVQKYQKHNTAVGCMKKVKKIFNLALNEKIINQNPFDSFKFKLNAVIPEYLTNEELKIIWEKDFVINRIKQVRDVFVFNCLTGLSFIDSKLLSKNHLFVDEDGNWFVKKSRQKTKIMATIPLLPIAVIILKQYDFSLPVLSNQKMNAYLKEIAVLCGINKTLTTHVARHTAATLLLNYGIKLSTVSAILGHSNLKMTQHYAKLLDKTIIQEMKGVKLLED